MGITSVWQASSTTVWSSAGAWSLGVPGHDDVASFTAGTGDCTIDAVVDVASIVGTAGTKFTVNADVTAGYIDTTRMFKVTAGNKVSVTSANSGGTLWLDPTSTGEVDVNLTGIGNYNVWNNSSNPSAGPLSAFKIAGTTGASYKLCARLNTAAIDASGITARFNLTCGTSGLGKILTVPSGCTVTMPSTPGWLNADHVDSSNGGTVTATGGIDQGSNVKWSGLLPPGTTHATSGALSGGTGTISGASRRFVSHSTSGALPGGYSEIEGVARRSVRQDVDVRNIEVFDERYNTDCTVVVDGDPSSPVTASDAFSILAGRIVWLKGWDRFFGKQVVDSVGILSLPSPLWKFYAGLPYSCIAETMPIPSAPLQNKNFSNIDVRVNKMRSLRINDSEVVFMNQGSEVDMPPPEFTGHKEVPNLGADKDATIKIVNELPYGGTILAIAGRLETGES